MRILLTVPQLAQFAVFLLGKMPKSSLAEAVFEAAYSIFENNLRTSSEAVSLSLSLGGQRWPP